MKLAFYSNLKNNFTKKIQTISYKHIIINY